MADMWKFSSDYSLQTNTNEGMQPDMWIQ